ncbi:unnamed protein product [Agarophyton chilense]
MYSKLKSQKAAAVRQKKISNARDSDSSFAVPVNGDRTEIVLEGINNDENYILPPVNNTTAALVVPDLHVGTSWRTPLPSDNYYSHNHENNCQRVKAPQRSKRLSDLSMGDDGSAEHGWESPQMPIDRDVRTKNNYTQLNDGIDPHLLGKSMHAKRASKFSVVQRPTIVSSDPQRE